MGAVGDLYKQMSATSDVNTRSRRGTTAIYKGYTLCMNEYRD
jgi:hypothetical protein